MNWHGLCSKFSDYHIDRQSTDKSIFKSSKLTILRRLKEYQVLIEKKKLQEFDNARQLLNIKKKREKAKHSRLVTLLENNKALDRKMQAAATEIQKWARGYLIRKQYKDEMWQITVKLLHGKVFNLENSVQKCLKYIGETAYDAAVTIQKNARRFLAKLKFKEIKEEEFIRKEKEKGRKVVKIQKVVRGFLDRKKVGCLRENRILTEKLENIRKKLLVCRLKEFWNRKKFVWETIRRKYKDRLEPESFIDDYSEHIVVEQVKENTGSLSKVVSNCSSHVLSHRNTVILKEPINFPTEKPPKVPKPLTLQYLKPTEAYLSRIADDSPVVNKVPDQTKLKNIRGKRYQRNTTSRTRYFNIVQTEKTVKSRAVSADYKKKREYQKSFEKTTEKFEDLKKPSNALSLLFDAEIPKYFNKQKTPAPPSILSRLEDYPAPIFEETVEKVYVYNPPKFQSLSFKEALPDVNALLESYSKSIKK